MKAGHILDTWENDRDSTKIKHKPHALVSEIVSLSVQGTLLGGQSEATTDSLFILVVGNNTNPETEAYRRLKALSWDRRTHLSYTDAVYTKAERDESLIVDW